MFIPRLPSSPIQYRAKSAGEFPVVINYLNRTRKLHRPDVDGEQLKNQRTLMETMFNGSWQTNVIVGSLNKNQVKRKFGKLIIGKTTGYTARWLYRLLKKSCISK